MASTSPASPAAPPARRGRPRKSAEERDENQRRADLVREAARLFRQQGFDGTSTRDIAAAAGMQSGSPFYYFESKSALLAAVMQGGMADAATRQAQALQALDDNAPPREQLRALIRQHLQVCLGKGSDFIPVMLYEWRVLTPAQRGAIARQKDAYEATWMPVLEALHQAGQLQADPQVARKRWINAMKEKGHIRVDAGAVAALRLGKSLLPAGVVAVTGSFGRGEPVAIEGPDGAALGKGLIRYTSEEARAIAGHRSGDIAVILGYQGRAALIHRDDMVI